MTEHVILYEFKFRVKTGNIKHAFLIIIKIEFYTYNPKKVSLGYWIISLRQLLAGIPMIFEDLRTSLLT